VLVLLRPLFVLFNHFFDVGILFGHGNLPWDSGGSP
jgi:hypothetical protein